MAEKLSDHEIRDITKALEAGIPIADKYRYLIFKEARQVELVWNGKNTHVQDVVLPFQVIEHIDEPRDEVKLEQQQSLFDTSGKKVQGWSNKLIWGDNKYVLSSLKSGPIRDEIEANGGIKLIYIDPPFDVGADFSTTIEIGDTEFQKAPTALEEIAFRDTWGMGQDSFLAMIYERLILMKDLLAEDGSIYVHCDLRLNSYLKVILEEIFGKPNFRSEIFWKRTTARAGSKFINNVSDSILFFTKSDSAIWNEQYTEYEKDYVQTMFRGEENGRKFRDSPLTAPGRSSGQSGFEWRNIDPGKIGKGRHWAIPSYVLKEIPTDCHGDTIKSLDALDKIGRITWSRNGVPNFKQFLDELLGVEIQNIWTDVGLDKGSYPTQKPEKLIERIVRSSSNEGDLIADFFAGSGTLAAVAEKLGRKWIVSDLGRFAINTTRKRLINIQRELKAQSKDFRSFEVLSIGSYSFDNQTQQNEFNNLVLSAYGAESLNNSLFAGKKANHFVAVGPLELPASRDFVDELVLNAKKQRLVELDILAFEFGMGVIPDAIEDAKKQGVKLNLKIIPREVFDKKAVADGAVRFSEVGYLDVKIESKKLEASLTLTDFSVFYSQDSLELDGENLQKGKSRVVLDNGIIKKIQKNKDGIVKIENIATSWIDWIDYWAIDFHFEDRQELKLVKHDDGRVEQIATGRNIFDNQWQSFKTTSEKIELTSSKYQYPKAGKYKIAVKVIDVFGNDTTRVFDINVDK